MNNFMGFMQVTCDIRMRVVGFTWLRDDGETTEMPGGNGQRSWIIMRFRDDKFVVRPGEEFDPSLFATEVDPYRLRMLNFLDFKKLISEDRTTVTQVEHMLTDYNLTAFTSAEELLEFHLKSIAW